MTKKVPTELRPIPIPAVKPLPSATWIDPRLPPGDTPLYDHPQGPDPNTEAGKANLELQKRKVMCYWCAGGACIPAWPADRFIRSQGKLRPTCRFHTDEADDGTSEIPLQEGLELVLVEGIHES